MVLRCVPLAPLSRKGLEILKGDSCNTCYAHNLYPALDAHFSCPITSSILLQPGDSEHAAHEKRLVKALLQRKLSHAFSSEELARLKQKGIYIEDEHEKLAAERLLVTRQVMLPPELRVLWNF